MSPARSDAPQRRGKRKISRYRRTECSVLASASALHQRDQQIYNTQRVTY